MFLEFICLYLCTYVVDIDVAPCPLWLPCHGRGGIVGWGGGGRRSQPSVLHLLTDQWSAVVTFCSGQSGICASSDSW